VHGGTDIGNGQVHEGMKGSVSEKIRELKKRKKKRNTDECIME
jgi:hypothetical protein